MCFVVFSGQWEGGQMIMKHALIFLSRITSLNFVKIAALSYYLCYELIQ